MSGLCAYNFKNFVRREKYLQQMTKGLITWVGLARFAEMTFSPVITRVILARMAFFTLFQ